MFPAGESLGLLARSEAPTREGAEPFPGAEPSHPHLSSPSDTGNLGSPAWESLGSGCNQRRERGVRGAGREPRGAGGGGPRPPGSRWQPLADAKTLRRLPGSRGCRQNACHRCGSTPTAFRSICFSRKTFTGFLSARPPRQRGSRPAPSKGLGQLQPPGSAWPAGTARCLCRGCLLCLYDVYSFF